MTRALSFGGSVANGPAVASREVASRPERCRCGTRIAAGTGCWAFATVPTPVDLLLASRRFCSRVCMRAELLEGLELFESRAAASAVEDVARVVDAYRDLYHRLTDSGG